MIDFHSVFAWFVVFINGFVGLWALVSIRVTGLEQPALWWTAIAAQVAVAIQVGSGVLLITIGGHSVSSFHVFYGVVSIITIALGWIYAQGSEWVKQRRPLFYGLLSLFLMGLALRAMAQANAL